MSSNDYFIYSDHKYCGKVVIFYNTIKIISSLLPLSKLYLSAL